MKVQKGDRVRLVDGRLKYSAKSGVVTCCNPWWRRGWAKVFTVDNDGSTCSRSTWYPVSLLEIVLSEEVERALREVRL